MLVVRSGIPVWGSREGGGGGGGMCWLSGLGSLYEGVEKGEEEGEGCAGCPVWDPCMRE